MVALALLAAHLAGDFVFQTRWQANGKLDDPKARGRHVYAYTLAFVPVVAIFWPGWARAAIFLGALWLLHFATDSRRFHSTLGDVIAWRFANAEAYYYDPGVVRDDGTQTLELRIAHYITRKSGLPLPANPWPVAPIAIDQTLHVVQLAALGWLLAS